MPCAGKYNTRNRKSHTPASRACMQLQGASSASSANLYKMSPNRHPLRPLPPILTRPACTYDASSHRRACCNGASSTRRAR
eukprot:748224-Prymnesium_polylepis.1